MLKYIDSIINNKSPMVSMREVERKYKSVCDFYSIEKINEIYCYLCSCGHITKTITIDAGVVPFKFKCEKCNNLATSSFTDDIAPEQQPTIEWFRPSLKETFKLRKKPDILEHVLNGGLIDRKII